MRQGMSNKNASENQSDFKYKQLDLLSAQNYTASTVGTAEYSEPEDISKIAKLGEEF